MLILNYKGTNKIEHNSNGCHFAVFWMGALADDVVLLTTSTQELQTMLEVYKDYGREHNLVFSIDPNPSKR